MFSRITDTALRLHTRAQLGLRRDEGATAVEYALMVALIATVIILTVTALGGRINAIFTDVKTALGG